ncbi:MAG: iron ABC transporter permease [Armatimonadota bacterium]|nr:iron ABC transporter permease [Armatimonadota bacterium]MDW8155053.1 iron ABC transporter permease [Armatimonadota bacterium]
MARAVALPQTRWAAQPAVAAWAAATVLAAAALPWGRAGRDLGSWLWDSTGVVLASGSLLAAGVLLASFAVLLAGLWPAPERTRGVALAAFGACGMALSGLLLGVRGTPTGPAGVLAPLGFLTLTGFGLSSSGRWFVDPFLSAAVLWAAAFVALFILLPLASVVVASVWVDGRFTLEVVHRTLTSPAFLALDHPGTPHNELAVAAAVGLAVAVGTLVLGWYLRWSRRSLPAGGAAGLAAAALASLYLGFGAFRNSLLLAVVVGAVSTALGFAFALLSERSQLPTRRLLGTLSALPIITPPFVLGIAMLYLFGRRGFVTYRLLGVSTDVFFGPLGVAVAQVLAYTPIAYLVLVGVVRALDASLEEAAQTLGASPWHLVRTVIWPLARPGLANAFLLVAIESLADFANPIVVGGGKPFLATEVFFAIVGRYNPHEAATYGAVLLALTLTVFVFQQRWLGGAFYVTVTGRPTGARPQPLPLWLDWALSAVFVVWMVVVVLLYGSVFVGAVTRLWGFDYTFTLRHLQDLHPQGWQVLRTTVQLSAYAAVPSVVVGFLIGYLVNRVDFPGRRALEFSSMLSFATPGTVMGIGYVLAFNQGPLLLTGTELVIVLAFVFRNMPVAIRAAVAALEQIDRSLEEASTMLRAGASTTLRRVVAPLARSALLSGLVFAFVRAMTAVSQVIFLITPQHNLATTQILSYLEYGSQGRGAALASVLTLLLVTVVASLQALSRRLDPRTAQLGAG